MRTLEAFGFQRLPSTNGASPLDAAKNDPVRQAIGLGIDWEDLLDVIDVVVANYNATAYNATANEALGNRSPLSLLGEYVGAGNLDWLPRRLLAPVATLSELSRNATDWCGRRPLPGWRSYRRRLTLRRRRLAQWPRSYLY